MITIVQTGNNNDFIVLFKQEVAVNSNAEQSPQTKKLQQQLDSLHKEITKKPNEKVIKDLISDHMTSLNNDLIADNKKALEQLRDDLLHQMKKEMKHYRKQIMEKTKLEKAELPFDTTN